MAKIALNKLQEEAFREDSRRKRARDDEKHEAQERRAQEAHEKKMAREDLRAEVEISEIRSRMALVKKKHDFEMEMLESQRTRMLLQGRQNK